MSLEIIELLIAFGPLRRREPWALAAAILRVDRHPPGRHRPRCLASITTKHGCHTFLISSALVVIGTLAVGLAGRNPHQPPSPQRGMS